MIDACIYSIGYIEHNSIMDAIKSTRKFSSALAKTSNLLQELEDALVLDLEGE